ncbi:tyrosine phosphatase-like protein [Peziza echinospora]|nr:tyrosine phosphatase-like protein [Peziza echinospora]
MAPSAPAQSSLTKNYLTIYNSVNAALWATILVRTISILVKTNGDVEAIYPAVGELTRWTQSIIALDFIHVLLGLVRTSLMTVLFQAYSRIFLVWLILPNSPLGAQPSIFHTSMLISWCIAEVVRYTFYVATALSTAPRWLVWMRYNLFYVLYITGAGSEWGCMYRSLGEMKTLAAAAGSDDYVAQGMYWLVLVMMVVWPILFPNQYFHMIALRRKMMRGKKRA